MKLGFLKEKKFGLPVWVWAIIVTALLFLLFHFFKNRAGSTAGSTAGTGTPAAAPDTSGGAGLASLPPSPLDTQPTWFSGSGTSTGGGSGGDNSSPDPTTVEIILPTISDGNGPHSTPAQINPTPITNKTILATAAKPSTLATAKSTSPQAGAAATIIAAANNLKEAQAAQKSVAAPKPIPQPITKVNPAVHPLSKATKPAPFVHRF